MRKEEMKEGMKVSCSDFNINTPLYVINMLPKEPKFVGVSWKSDCPKNYEFVVNIDKLTIYEDSINNE